MFDHTVTAVKSPDALQAEPGHTDPEYATDPADYAGLEFCETADEALVGANALAIVTEWKNFWSPDFGHLAEQLADKAIFDGRNLYEPAALKPFGLRYFAIGRGEQLSAESAWPAIRLGPAASAGICTPGRIPIWPG